MAPMPFTFKPLGQNWKVPRLLALRQHERACGAGHALEAGAHLTKRRYVATGHAG
jgi:hypothetical protein